MYLYLCIYLGLNLDFGKEDMGSRIIGSKFGSNGATIAFHKDDHALAAVEEVGNTLNPGTSNTLKLETVKVIFKIYSRVHKNILDEDNFYST